ncbi:hypothetical protein B0T14DRAFT_514905, partial [Immersiella caudata]
MEKPLGPRDCGSWIRNAATGKLFGHVVAGSPTTGLAIVMRQSTPLHMLERLSEAGLSRNNREAVLMETQLQHKFLNGQSLNLKRTWAAAKVLVS